MDKVSSKPRRGDVVNLKSGCRLYYLKSDQRLSDEMAADARAGRFFDSAGEGILYSKIGAETLKDAVVATVTRTRGIQWPTFSGKPPGLVEMFATIEGVPRIFTVPWTYMSIRGLAETCVLRDDSLITGVSVSDDEVRR